MSEAWSPTVDGLRISAVAPSGVALPGRAWAIELRFHNAGDALRRIYLLRSEPFRAMQSTFVIDRGPGRFPSVQPEPRPHGIVVTEDDFHALAPGEIRTFTQRLVLPDDLARGTCSVRWQYANRVERWEGGVPTLDGRTRALFGGGRIPGIWVGTVEVRFEVVFGER